MKTSNLKLSFKIAALSVALLGTHFAQAESAFLRHDSNFSNRIMNEIQNRNIDALLTQSPACVSSARSTENVVISKSTLYQFFNAEYYHDLFTQYGKATKITNAGKAYNDANSTVNQNSQLLNDLYRFIDLVYPQTTARLSYARPSHFDTTYNSFVSSQGYSGYERAQFDLMVTSFRKVIVENVGRYFGLIRTGRICDIPYEKYFAMRLYSQGAYLLFDRESFIDSRFHQSLRLVKNLMVSILGHIRPYSGDIYIGTSIPYEEWSTLKAGEEYSYSSFMSGSANSGFTNFIKNAVLVVRKNLTGVLISSISSFPYEGEVIWNAPTFRILRATTDNQNRIWIEVEEVQ